MKALSWALAAAMRPSMSMLALGVRTRGLAVLEALATTGVVALDSSSAYMVNTLFKIIPLTSLSQAYAISAILEDATGSPCCFKAFTGRILRQGVADPACWVACLMTLKQCKLSHRVYGQMCKRLLARHLHGCAAGQW